MTGRNPKLAAQLLICQFGRIGKGGPKTWIDAGYCIDAPNMLAAGSTARYQSDQRDNSDWYDVPTLVYRVHNDAQKGDSN